MSAHRLSTQDYKPNWPPDRRAEDGGRGRQVGNFRVEPPGLFRGRGEHPKMGMIKRRIYPRDITINIGALPHAPCVLPNCS